MDEITPAAPAHKNRKIGLIIFGILTILLGGICALLVPFLLFGAAMSGKTDEALDYRMILPGVLMYGGLAVALVWLGIGSILLRRWARAILLMFSWIWLIFGIFTGAMMAVVIPQAMAATTPQAAPGALMVAYVVMAAFMGFFFFVLPLCWVLFYRSRHVKATCEAHCPQPAWTDRCPLPVLALSLTLAFSAVTLLFMPFAYRGVLPFFGTFISGWAGGAIYWLLAVVWAYGAWATYRLDKRGWWIVVVMLTVFGISTFITYYRHTIAELYERMGLPAQEIAQIQAIPWMTGHNMAWMTLGSCALMVGYVLFTGRYFKSASP